jgi:hypothetical protein
MKKSRSIYELLKIVETNFDMEFKTGLCALFSQLCVSRTINKGEQGLLHNYIHAHRPKNERKRIGALFFWAPFDSTPRIRFIRRLIKQLETKGNEKEK